MSSYDFDTSVRGAGQIRVTQLRPTERQRTVYRGSSAFACLPTERLAAIEVGLSLQVREPTLNESAAADQIHRFADSPVGRIYRGR